MPPHWKNKNTVYLTYTNCDYIYSLYIYTCNVSTFSLRLSIMTERTHYNDILCPDCDETRFACYGSVECSKTVRSWRSNDRYGYQWKTRQQAAGPFNRHFHVTCPSKCFHKHWWKIRVLFIIRFTACKNIEKFELLFKMLYGWIKIIDFFSDMGFEFMFVERSKHSVRAYCAAILNGSLVPFK